MAKVETILYLFGGIANMVAVAGGAVAAIFIGWAGIQWMMASGDPQKMSHARSSVIGVLVGLVLLGASFLIPDAINQRLIRPATGVSLESVVGLDCDRMLKNQLVRQRTASDWQKMGVVVRRVQASREECNAAVWAPVITRIRSGGWSRCNGVEIGQTDVPRGLQEPGASTVVKNTTSRDAKNNIIVYFGANPNERPSDGAWCWLYSSRLKIWDQEY